MFLNQNKNFFLINKLFNFFFSKLTQKKILEKFYLSRDDIIDIDRKGMIIGGHSHSHKLLSSLSFKDQNKEIKKNINYLSKIFKKKNRFLHLPGVTKNHTIPIQLKFSKKMLNIIIQHYKIKFWKIIMRYQKN